MNGFMTFVREQGVVGLAVGLAIGASAGEAVQAIVDNFINPLVGLALGKADLSEIVIPLGTGEGAAVIGIGNIINALIALFAVAFVIYFIVKKTGLDKLDVATEDE